MSKLTITCCGCLHGHYPETPGGDLLIVTGDLTARDNESEINDFDYWLYNQIYKFKIVIGGNHDNYIQKTPTFGRWLEKSPSVEYLEDSGTKIKGLKVWGSPWTSRFPGINKSACAFTVYHDLDLEEKFNLIPEDTDILVTHGPAWGILDQNDEGYNCGSRVLRSAVERIKPRLHIFSHIHERGSETLLLKHDGPNTLCINCSHMNERYQPVHEPITIEV